MSLLIDRLIAQHDNCARNPKKLEQQLDWIKALTPPKLPDLANVYIAERANKKVPDFESQQYEKANQDLLMGTLAANIITHNKQIRANLMSITQDVIPQQDLGKKRHQPEEV